jgi:hypothetical protein
MRFAADSKRTDAQTIEFGAAGDVGAARDSPYCRSKMHVWQTFLVLAHIWQSTVCFGLAFGPGFHLNTVYGRSHILQAPPCGSLVMRR